MQADKTDSYEFGVDVCTFVSKEQWANLKINGYKFAIVRAYRSLGIVDQNARQTLINAHQVGLKVEVYMFPSCGKDPELQVDEMVQQLPDFVERVWIDIERNPRKSCNWGGNFEQNAHFVNKIVERIQLHGKRPGIYSGFYEWKVIFGQPNKSQQFNHIDLWFVRLNKHVDMSGYDDLQFGGWKTPYMKQYEHDIIECGVGIDKNLRLC